MKDPHKTYLECLADVKVILEFLLNHLGIDKYGRKELGVLMREAAMVLLLSRSKKNPRVVVKR